MQDYVNNFIAKLEATEDRKQPNMSNTGKNIANVKKGKNGNFRGLKFIIESLGIGNTIIHSLKGIELNNVQTKLPTRAKTSMIERVVSRVAGIIELLTVPDNILLSVLARKKVLSLSQVIRSSSGVREIRLLHAL